MFVVGLLEGEFPQTPGDQGLLTHADRDLMIHQGAELPDCFENKVLREGLVTHIVPEWYFLPIHAILRSIPDKSGGVAATDI